MKIIQHINGTVVDILNARIDATIDNITIANEIPIFEPREGYNGVLKYSNENGLYWDYEAITITDEISSEELQSMIEEVL